LSGGFLKTEVEGFLLQLAELELEFVGSHFADGFDFGFGHGSDR
jgi:hypothetical protein